MKQKKGRKILSLSSSRSSHVFSSKESLWDDELKRIFTLLSKHSKSLAAQKEEDEEHDREEKSTPINRLNTVGPTDHERNMLSISLFGTYGSGKSSLLRTLVDRVNRAKYGEYIGNDANLSIFSLPVLEPNLLDKDDHFLYAFLAAALEEDRKRQEAYYHHHGDSQILSPIQQKFQSVSEFLQAIDHSERREENDDPLGISLERLDRHSSGLRLQEHLFSFLNTLANELAGQKPFSMVLLPVDDADMKIQNLVSTLNSYRRFLQHPRLVPVFTFTGRIAEEQLRVYFEKRLTIGDRKDDSKKLYEASTSLTIAENLTIQYLGKLFPVRNRIKLGLASARVQEAQYVEEKHDASSKEKPVFELLKTATTLLFGCPQWPVLPDIRSPLRSSTLRRQIQLLDAMHASDVYEFIPVQQQSEEKIKPKELSIPWGGVFDRATWSLLNVHRDVLKEYHLDLDDLYSWTPQGLRHVVLKTILEDDLAKRRQLIQHWRYRTEDRRSQMLSLLAANTFRPRMYMEAPRGDNPVTIEARLEHGTNWERINNDRQKHQNHLRSFSARKGTIWFLELWIGFYLPQILARNRPTGVKGMKHEIEPLSSVGWNIRSGPVHAMRAAITNNQIISTGMMFLEASLFSEKVIEIQGMKPGWIKLLIQIWSYYGNEDNGVWAAVSFWRGLSLLCQILQKDVEYVAEKIKPIDKEEVAADQLKHDQERKEKIISLLYQHLKTARVLGTPPTGRDSASPQKGNANWKDKGSPPIPSKEFSKFAFWRFDDFEDTIKELAKETLDWLDNFPPELYRVYPFPRVSERDDSQVQDAEKTRTRQRADWKACFTRRVQAESLIAIFWQDLEHPLPKELSKTWTAKDALCKWTKQLAKYWDCGEPLDKNASERSMQQSVTQALLLECPFLKPFAPLGFSEINNLKGIIVGLKQNTQPIAAEPRTKKRIVSALEEIQRNLKKVEKAIEAFESTKKPKGNWIKKPLDASKQAGILGSREGKSKQPVGISEEIKNLYLENDALTQKLTVLEKILKNIQRKSDDNQIQNVIEDTKAFRKVCDNLFENVLTDRQSSDLLHILKATQTITYFQDPGN